MSKHLFFVSLIWVFVVGGFVKIYGAHHDQTHIFDTPLGDSDVLWVAINVNDTYQQGDAHLIMARKGPVVLIDAGAIVRTNETLLPFLRQYQIEKIDTVIITHPHTDHYSGVIGLLEAGFPIGEIYWAEPSGEACAKEYGSCFPETLENLKHLAARASIPMKSLLKFDELDVGPFGKLKKIFHQTSECKIKTCTINDTSFINELRVGATRALFTGDLTSPTGAWLKANLAESLPATILKVPHHGTTDLPSNEFFEKVNPSLAIVPAPESLWCMERSAGPHAWLMSHVPTYINGIHGHIFVHLFRDRAPWVRTQFHPDRMLHCKYPSFWERHAIFR